MTGFRLQRPDVVFYHADCPDGFGAAWALRHFFPEHEGTRYEPLAYGSRLPAGSCAGLRVLMVDVSLPRPDFLLLSSEASVMLIDHHASAAKSLADLPNTYFDAHRSGAGLAWDLASGGQPRPLLIDLIEDRDLNRYCLPQTHLLRVLDSLPLDFLAWTGFAKDLVDHPRRLESEARAIARHERTLACRIVFHAQPVVQQGVRGWIVNAPAPLADAVGKELLDRPDAAFSMSWFYDSHLCRASCSWRTRPGAPVLAVDLAQQYGGGGHEHAAGARLSMEEVSGLLAILPPPSRDVSGGQLD